MRTARVAQILVTIEELSTEELQDLKTEVIELYKEREYLEYLQRVNSKNQNK